MWQLRLNTENPAYQAPLDAIKYKYNCKVANGSKSVETLDRGAQAF